MAASGRLLPDRAGQDPGQFRNSILAGTLSAILLCAHVRGVSVNLMRGRMRA